MKRLVILTKNYGYNFTGATMATQQFVKCWSQKFEEVVVYTLHEGERFKQDNIFVNIFSQMPFLVAALRSAEKEKYDTIYYSDDHFGFLLALLGKKYFHTYHGNWPDAAKISLKFWLKSFYFRPLYYLTLKNAAYIINVSYYMKKFTDTINKNSTVIRNGMDFKLENHRERKLPNTCLMVGNVDQRKYKYCVALARILQAKKSSIKIDIYGKILDHNVADELGEFENVRLMGMVRNIPYQSYDVFLNLSIIENLSISVCEAIANHVPVICFDVGGLGEVVKNGITGYVVPNKNINQVYNDIVKTLRNPIHVDDSVLSDFKWDCSADKYVKLFEEIEYGK
jgi:glycosyltransferase involved in cell wall biosynthesis